jgi:3-oxoacyl-[acyl-carrier-protein] synthase II
MMGTALGGVGYAEQQCGVWHRDGLRAVDPGLALMVFGGAASCNMAIELGVQGPNVTNSIAVLGRSPSATDSVRSAMATPT